MLFAAADFRVSLYDLDPGQLDGALHDIQIQLGNLQSQGLLRGNLILEQQVANIHPATDLAQCVTGAIYVQECVPERLEIKTGVYQLMDNLLSDTCILASSASALLPSKLAADLKHKNRFIVAHPTNPPFYAPLVELVPSPWTDPDVVPTTKALMDQIGQVPVVLKKEISGFVLNRIQYSIMREAWWLIKDGVIDVEGLDKVMSEGLGRRYAFMGPLETAYLNADGMYSYSERYADMIEGVMSTFKGHERLEGPTLDDIQRQLEVAVPMDSLQSRRSWRDRRLSALAQLKQKMDQEDTGTSK